MPVEPDLPAELKAVESLLQQFSPVESAINRDASLYATGWAAALAQAPTKSHWLWPTTSGVLAASLLLLLTLRPAPPALPASSIQRAGTEPQAPTNQAHNRTPPPQIPFAQAPPPRIFTPPPKRYSPTAPMLTMRDRALRMEFDEPVSFVGMDDDYVPKTMTARELLQEILGETS